MLTSAVLLVGTCLLSVAALTEANTQRFFRSCTFCHSLNCVEVGDRSKPWWSCCLAALPGRCVLEFEDAENRSTLWAACNVTGMQGFSASCSTSDERCAWDPLDPSTASIMCQRLCMAC